MMQTTITLAKNLHISPFEIFQQECDEVILLINFYIMLGNQSNESDKSINKQPKHDKNERIRVNDKTATGGWF